MKTEVKEIHIITPKLISKVGSKLSAGVGVGGAGDSDQRVEAGVAWGTWRSLELRASL